LQIIGVLPNLQSQTQYEPREEVEADIWWQLEATRRDRGRKASAKLKSTGYSTFYQRNVPPGFVPTEIPLDEALKGFFRYYADFDFDQKIISIRVRSSLRAAMTLVTSSDIHRTTNTS